MLNVRSSMLFCTISQSSIYNLVYSLLISSHILNKYWQSVWRKFPIEFRQLVNFPCNLFHSALEKPFISFRCSKALQTQSVKLIAEKKNEFYYTNGSGLGELKVNMKYLLFTNKQPEKLKISDKFQMNFK